MCDFTKAAFPSIRAKIKAGMARAFFMVAYAELAEQSGRESFFSGKDYADYLPSDIDPSAIHAAQTLTMDIETQFGNLVDFYQCNMGSTKNAEEWGHYAAMQAMGHGVSLHDYGIDVRIPYNIFGSYSLDRDYFLTLGQFHIALERGEYEIPYHEVSTYGSHVKKEWSQIDGDVECYEEWGYLDAIFYVRKINGNVVFMDVKE